MTARVVSLFSGAGGLDYAFDRTGAYESLLRVELQAEFCETLRLNESTGVLSDARVEQTDVRSVDGEAARRLAGRGRPLVVIGGPPCESFSSMGHRRGGLDPRGRLVEAFGAFVVSADADAFVMENVPALEQADGGALFAGFVGELESMGYSVVHRVLNAADYGAATTRKRLIVLGSRLGVPLFPEPTHASPGGFPWLTDWVSVGAAIGDLPPPARCLPGQPQGHVLVCHTQAVRDRFAGLRQGSYDDIRKRSRLSWDRPSPSLVAGNLGGIRSHIHPTEARELTNRESARIQGFPDAYAFAGRPAAVGKQIANAVPIALGAAVAGALARHVGSAGAEAPPGPGRAA